MKDLQLEYRRELATILDNIGSIKAIAEEGSPAYQRILEWDLKKDRLLLGAKKTLSKDEFKLLRAWVRKEQRASWVYES